MSLIRIDERGVTIKGRRITLLCSSLFYFRVPEGSWVDRLRKIKSAGYNCIDVYFPWNFHETRPGRWDLQTGMRNAPRFLELAAAEGLSVIARPGPYICSEWDGGALPAWLPTEPMAIRQNDPVYLARVRQWYERILPVIARFQADRDGSVILVQIENELDFFNCADPAGYLSALRDMARSAGITVPLLACAGQGDLDGAWAGIPDVVPAVNLYPDNMRPGLEQGMAAFQTGLGRRGFPLLVMETGRDAFLLRQLVSHGAKLLGAYNQVGGYDFGFTTSVNNWGTPLSFQTAHYDFDSLVGAFGEVREESWEHQALSGFLESLGPVMAGALPCRDHGLRIKRQGKPVGELLPVLRLLQKDREGFAVGLHNTDDSPLRLVFETASLGLPAQVPMTVGPHGSAFALINLSLSPWGLPGAVLFSSAEPFVIQGGEHPLIVLQSMQPAEIQVDLGGGVRVFRFNGRDVMRESLPLPGGTLLTLLCAGRRMVREAWRAECGLPRESPSRGSASPDGMQLSWRLAPVEPDALFPSLEAISGGRSLYMEDNGAYRGFALYHARIPDPRPKDGLGILLHDASDVLSLYCGGEYLGTRVPGGEHAWFPFPDSPPMEGSLLARAETWGHSNFDDPRLPSIRIGSRRGISGATLLTKRDLLFPWALDRAQPAPSGIPALGHPGGGLTATVPARLQSSCTVAPAGSADRFFLWAEAAECATMVEVDGRSCGWIDGLHPILDLSGLLEPDREARISLTPQKWYAAESPGAFYFAQGRAFSGWSMSRAEEPELLASADAHHAAGRDARPPLRIPPGGVAWLSAVIPSGGLSGDHALTLRGSNVKASVFLNETLVGRLFLPSAVRPRMAGGRDDCAYLPSCWLRTGENAVRILLEAVGDAAGLVDSITTEAVP